jgi:sugar phosphate isomerase/epimerase
MFRNLNPALIGAKTSLDRLTKQARGANFDGMDIDVIEAADLISKKSIHYVKKTFEENGLRFGGWYLPTRWKEEERCFHEDLEQLSRQSLLAKKLGCTRATTWISPYSDELSYEKNLEWHRNRLIRIAEALKKNDCSLALEFVGTKTYRTGHKYEFIHNLEGILELLEAVKMKNVGLLMDSWHWYVSGGRLQDLKQLSTKEVFYVHVNDAPRNVQRDEQIDLVRCLPGETGVIDLVSFLHWLENINYEGPVTPEPFSKKLKDLNASEAIRVVGEALDQVWKKAELD